ncbi:hypothetical protein RHMOL_Rhmol06G0167500 [Rhododendron molle]|uniref:Uncharacterized protein n=1 Tax=Rhododendron molle TaxID=49168 RepID=A0ACC0NCZ3_RHOML|nr:hypothetical protein RHMOL_Rhmol06G0167500 [Rhododendron molle]
MKFSTVIAACRHFSSKTSSRYPKWTRNNKKKSKVDDPKTSERTRITWTGEQSQVLDAISSGKSVFITGSSGTGKTLLLQHIIKRLKKLHHPSRVFATASTGLAACAIKGWTLHSFAGIGLGEDDRQTLLLKVISNRWAYKRWTKARALVIDEVSMVDAEIFDALEFIAREVRGGGECDSENKVWGGIQLVVCGDFFQLPPIVKRENRKEFAFEADCWGSSFDMQVELTRVFRQSEANLVKLLQNVRRGEVDHEDLDLLKKCCTEAEPDSSAVQLYPRNQDVNRVNKKKMEDLKKPTYIYHAHDSGEDPWLGQLNQGIAPDELPLCEGARVMLCKNLRRTLVNGATGTVTKFRYDDVAVSDLWKTEERPRVPMVRFDSGLEVLIGPEAWEIVEGGKVVATRKQLPLILAWALSIHKCQGMTLDRLHTNLSRAFGFGMVYVALSRIRMLAGLHLAGFKPSKIKAHPKVLEFYQRFSQKQDKGVEDGGVCEDGSGSSDVASVSNKTNGKDNDINSSLIFLYQFVEILTVASASDHGWRFYSYSCFIVGTLLFPSCTVITRRIARKVRKFMEYNIGL